MEKNAGERFGSEKGTLLLWDVDDTLISAFPDVESLYSEAVSKVVGSAPAGTDVRIHGRTEMAILADFARQAGVDERSIPVILPIALFELERIFDQVVSLYLSRCSVLPGVTEAIVSLADMGALNTVVTGNTRLNCWRKMQVMRLDSHMRLRMGGYGDESVDRHRLITLAMTRVGLLEGLSISRSRTVVIGDTPLDAVAARRAGVKVVLVATGKYDLSVLRRSTPDLVLNDLSEGLSSLQKFVGSI